MKYVPPYGSPGEDDPYINGDPSIGQQGSIPPAASIEHPQREITNFIKNSDMIPDPLDLDQLAKGVRHQWVNFCTDTGAVNALSVSLVPPLQEYRQGLPLKVLVASNNTGPTTINVNSLGARPILRPGGAQLQADDMRAGMVASIVDDGTQFQLQNFLGAIGGTTNNYNIDIPYAQDSSVTANTITAGFVPAITAVVAGDLVLVRVANANTGPVTIGINALPGAPLRRNDGVALASQDLLKDECILIEYNVTYWQMIRLVRSQVYFKLLANLTLWVRPDGSDTNDGATNTPARAFKTIQRAIDYVRESYMIAGRTVTIRLGVPGVYIGNVWVVSLPGSVIVQGDAANINSFVIQGVGQNTVVVAAGSGADLSITGVTVSCVSSVNHAMECDYGATMNVYDVAFSGVAINAALMACTSGQIVVSSTIHCYRNAGVMFGITQSGSLTIGIWNTLINTHGVTFTSGFCNVSQTSAAQISYPYCTFSGGAVGPRYNVYSNASLSTYGGENYLPGNSPGYCDASSVYS